MAKSFYTNTDPNKALANAGGQDTPKKRGRNKTQTTLSDIVLSAKLQPAEQEPTPQPTKRKPGRPKTKDVKNTCRNINVALPVTLLDKWDAVKIIHGNNLTAYITGLIQKDMDANFDKYINIINTLNNI